MYVCECDVCSYIYISLSVCMCVNVMCVSTYIYICLSVCMCECDMCRYIYIYSRRPKKLSVAFWYNVRLFSECNRLGSVSDCVSKRSTKCSVLQKRTVLRKCTIVRKRTILPTDFHSVGDMVYSRHEKQRILYHRFKGLKDPTIAKILVEEERLGVTRQGPQRFLKRHRETRMADNQAMGGHLLSQKMSRRLWRLKCRLVLNFNVPCL